MFRSCAFYDLSWRVYITECTGFVQLWHLHELQKGSLSCHVMEDEDERQKASAKDQ